MREHLKFLFVFFLFYANSCEFTKEEEKEIYQIKNYYINQVQIPKRSGFLVQKDFLFFNPEKYLGSYFIYTNNPKSRHSHQKNSSMNSSGQFPDFVDDDSIINIIRFENFFNKKQRTDNLYVRYYIQMYHLYYNKNSLKDSKPYKMLLLNGHLQGYLQSHLILNTSEASQETERVVDYIKNNNNHWDYLAFIVTGYTYREAETAFNLEKIEYQNSANLNFYNGVYLKKQLEEDHYNHRNLYMNELLDGFLFYEEDNERLPKAFYLLIKNIDMDRFVIRRPAAKEFEQVVLSAFDLQKERDGGVKYIKNILLPFYNKKINDISLFKEINSYIPIENSYSTNHKDKNVDFYYQRYYSHKD